MSEWYGFCVGARTFITIYLFPMSQLMGYDRSAAPQGTSLTVYQLSYSCSVCCRSGFRGDAVTSLESEAAKRLNLGREPWFRGESDSRPSYVPERGKPTRFLGFSAIWHWKVGDFAFSPPSHVPSSSQRPRIRGSLRPDVTRSRRGGDPYFHAGWHAGIGENPSSGGTRPARRPDHSR